VIGPSQVPVCAAGGLAWVAACSDPPPQAINTALLARRVGIRKKVVVIIGQFSHALKDLPQQWPERGAIALPRRSDPGTFARLHYDALQVTFAGLAWFRRRQRALARSVLALFCLTWLQLAALPCVMASSTPDVPEAVGTLVPAVQTVPAMDAATGHDCIYCPPPAAEQPQCDDHVGCAYPHDPQMDSRTSLALGMALPAVAPVLVLELLERTDAAIALNAPPLTVPRAPLAVSYCRFLK
jgi:hypothetical protein